MRRNRSVFLGGHDEIPRRSQVRLCYRPLGRRGLGPGAGRRRVPRQHLHDQRTGDSRRVFGCRGELCRGLGERRTGRGRRGHLRQALRRPRTRPGSRVPGQYLHDARPTSAQRGIRPTGAFVVAWARAGLPPTTGSSPTLRRDGRTARAASFGSTVSFPLVSSAGRRSRRMPPATSSSRGSGLGRSYRRVRANASTLRAPREGPSSRSTPTRPTTGPGAKVAQPSPRTPPATSSSSGRAGAGRELAGVFGQSSSLRGPRAAPSSRSTPTRRTADVLALGQRSRRTAREASSWPGTVPPMALAGTDVFARRFDAAGAPLGDEFQINTYTTGDQEGPALAPDPGGGFIVTWRGDGPNGGWGTVGRRLRASGAPRGAEFAVSSQLGAITVHGLGHNAGDFVVVTARQSWLTPGPVRRLRPTDVHARRLGGVGPDRRPGRDSGLGRQRGPRAGRDGRRAAVLEEREWRHTDVRRRASSFGGPAATGVSYQLPDGAAPTAPSPTARRCSAASATRSGCSSAARDRRRTGTRRCRRAHA